MTRIFTARISYAGADRLDITRKSAGPDGLPFAPSGRILWPMIALRRRSPEAVDTAWPKYVADFTAEMRRSYRDRRPAWDALMARDEVTFVCYCADAEHCHRAVLARILVKLGATYAGERPTRTKRDEAKLDGIEWMANAIFARVARGERPFFRSFVVWASGSLTLWPRPSEAR